VLMNVDLHRRPPLPVFFMFLDQLYVD
jgi:hypothetical protein